MTALAFSPDGQMMASGSEDGTLMLWNLKDARRFALVPQHKGPIWSLAYSRGEGSILASGETSTETLAGIANFTLDAKSHNIHSSHSTHNIHSPIGSIACIAFIAQ